MYNSYLMAIMADERRRQRITDAEEYRKAQATRPETLIRPERPTRPIRRRLARLIFAN